MQTFDFDAYCKQAEGAARAARVNGYDVRAYRDGGESFSCHLTRDGVTVATVRNDGHGGCHRYGWTSRDERVRAETMAARLLPGALEAIDTIVSALIDGR
jgi:hypothetical protein